MKSLAILVLLLIAPFQAAAQSYQGLWWNSPAGSESGWGLNITHQGDILFATWFTYDANGNGQWLVMPRAELQPTMDDGMMDMDDMMGMMGNMMMPMQMPMYSGTLYRTTGPAFDAATFDPNAVTTTLAGYGTFTFSDYGNGSFDYVLDGVYGAKAITREAYSILPSCDFSDATTANFQDLWWRSGGTESGWGVNIAQEGDVIFATWFTYDENGKGAWFVMPDTTKVGDMAYQGKIYRTTGPAVTSQKWSSTSVVATEVGTASFAFSDASNGTFTAKVGAATIVKPISRQLYASPASACR